MRMMTYMDSVKDLINYYGQEYVLETLFDLDMKSYKFLSPFRPDNSPSCSFFRAKNNNLYIVDWTEGRWYSVYDSIKAKFILPEDIPRIQGMLENGQKNDSIDYTVVGTKKLSAITVKLKEWDKETYAYWDKFHITKKSLSRFIVFPVETAVIDREGGGSTTYR